MTPMTLQEHVQNELHWINDLSYMVRGAYEGNTTEYEIIKFVLKNWDAPAYTNTLHESTDILNMVDTLIGLEENIKEHRPESSASVWSSIFDYDSQWEDEDEGICNQIAFAIIHSGEYAHMKQRLPHVSVPTKYNDIMELEKGFEPDNFGSIWVRVDQVNNFCSQVKLMAHMLERVVNVIPELPHESLLKSINTLDVSPVHRPIMEEFLKDFNTQVSFSMKSAKDRLEEKLKNLIVSHYKL